jgi:signal peptidase I
MGRDIRVTLARASITAVVCIVLFKFVLRPAWTDGISMVPTIQNHRLYFINLLAYSFGEPQRLDIVAIRGHGRSFLYLKRVLALPGETIAFERGELLINGDPVEEPYTRQGGRWSMSPQRLGPQQYFVAGDNRSMPMHMHLAGVTDRDWIEGRLLW